MRRTRLLPFLTFTLVMILGNMTNAQEGQRKTVVCSTTQIADFARNIVGDRWDVICVLAPGEDPHTYETGTDDAANVAKADLCLDNGWNLEGHSWMRKLANSQGKPIQTCVENVTPLQLDEDGETVNDPHAWFDPLNAAIYVQNIIKAVSKIDPANAKEYEARGQLYLIQLKALDNWIKRQIALSELSPNQRVLITHHDAFGYFCKRYGFDSFSPVGWTTGELTDVGIEARKSVIEQIRKTGVKAIFVETTINQELLQGIAREAGVEIGGKLFSDAMGPADSAGETYIGMMRENVLTILNSLK